MANNRMYLVHVPSGLAVNIGKRMGWGWYLGSNRETLQERLEAMFDELENDPNGSQDDFAIALEDESQAPHAVSDDLATRIIDSQSVDNQRS